jgi:hypothetical protein
MATAVLNEIKWAMDPMRELTKASTGKFNPGTGEFLTMLHLHGVYLALGEEQEIGALKQAVDAMLTDNEITGLVSEYVKQENEMAENENILQYQTRINEVVSDIRAGLPIKGKRACQICKELHEHIFKDSEAD